MVKKNSAEYGKSRCHPFLFVKENFGVEKLVIIAIVNLRTVNNFSNLGHVPHETFKKHIDITLK